MNSYNHIPSPAMVQKLFYESKRSLDITLRSLGFNAIFKDYKEELSGANVSGKDKLYYQHPNQN